MSNTPPIPLLSIVVPCYNEEGNVPHLYERLKAASADYAIQGVEIILVNDGSSDNTWDALSKLCSLDNSVVAVGLSRNFGHQLALTAGLEHARGERVLIIDADLQDPPELLPQMMRKMDEGYDVVSGKRISRLGESVFKKISAYLFYRILAALSDIKIPVDTGDFRLVSRRAINSLLSMPERVRYSRGLVSWVGYKQSVVEYVRDERFSGKTNYSLADMLRLATHGLTSFSTAPLQISVWIGTFMMLLSAALISYVFYEWLSGETIRGWTSLVAIFLFFQAIQFLILGVIGNYLAVIFREIKGRPLYLIDTVINKK